MAGEQFCPGCVQEAAKFERESGMMWDIIATDHPKDPVKLCARSSVACVAPFYRQHGPRLEFMRNTACPRSHGYKNADLPRCCKHRRLKFKARSVSGLELTQHLCDRLDRQSEQQQPSQTCTVDGETPSHIKPKSDVWVRLQ